MSLEFLDAVNTTITYINITVPIAIEINGNISGNNIVLKNESINISKIALNILYNTETVPKRSQYIYTLDNSMVFFDLSVNSINGSFSNITYIGNLNIQNVLLYSTPGYIYTMELQYGLTYSPEQQQNTDIAYIQANMISNINFDYLFNNPNNESCIVHDISNIGAILPLSVTTINL
jgi:hypothetical protein